MSTLLLHIVGDMTLNGTVFPPNLYIYNDLIIFRKRKLLSVKEVTISYNQISQVTLNKGIFFADLEIKVVGEEDFYIKWVSKKDAKKAKTLIDQKIYHSHAKHQSHGEDKINDVAKFEKTLGRLNELLERGEISEKEFLRKKSKYLSDLK